MILQIRASIALQYNISESLVQVTLSSSSTNTDDAGLRHLLSESEYHFDVLIMTRSKEEFARVANVTSAEPPRILEEVERTVIPVSLQQGAVVLCPANEVSTGKACVCAAGYARCAQCGKCLACAPGLAKSDSGDAACNTCANNTFSRAAAAQCSACPFSAKTKDNHTTCACNTAFVFLKDTCTATDSVYLELTGVLQLQEGEFADAELEQILVDGFSEYLDFSKEFITIIINHENEIASNATSNSSSRRRTLLLRRRTQFNYTALMRVELNDPITLAKITNISAEAKNKVMSITDAAGHQIDVGNAALKDEYTDVNGQPVEACADGSKKVADEVTQALVCVPPKPPPKPPPEANTGDGITIGGSIGGVAGFLVFSYVIYRCCCRQSKTAQRPAEPPKQTQVGQSFGNSLGRAMFPARLQCPATVSFEYHLLPGQSI